MVGTNTDPTTTGDDLIESVTVAAALLTKTVCITYKPLQSLSGRVDPGFPRITDAAGAVTQVETLTGEIPAVGSTGAPGQFVMNTSETFTLQVGTGGTLETKTFTFAEVDDLNLTDWWGFRIWNHDDPLLPACKTNGSNASLKNSPLSLGAATACMQFNGFSPADALAGIRRWRPTRLAMTTSRMRSAIRLGNSAGNRRTSCFARAKCSTGRLELSGEWERST